MIANRLPVKSWVTIFGPGTLVMLADADAGSLILSAQNGAAWGYQLLILQLFLIPVLFMAQELTMRLGLVTQKGQTELIKEYYGNVWAGIAVLALVICCLGALLTEFSGLAAVGALFNIPAWKTLAVVSMFLIGVVWTGSYRSIERIAILLGMFEIIFVILAWHARPQLSEIKNSIMQTHWNNPSYLYMISANIGAVIMPWMIFFQQSAVVNKGLTIDHMKTSRMDIALGAVLTQVIVAAVLIFTASTIGKVNPHASLESVTDISHAMTPLIGDMSGRVLFALAMAGAAIVATIVVSLTTVWGISEMLGLKHSLQDNPRQAPIFYWIYTALILLCASFIVFNDKNLVSISVNIEVMNALILPLVLFFVYKLTRIVLPERHMLKGWYAVVVAGIFIFTSLFGLCAGLLGLVAHS